MSALKLACERAAAVVKLPRRGDRIEVERAEQRIRSERSGPSRVKEAWAGFLARIDPTLPGDLKPNDLKRLLDGIWAEATLDDSAAPLLDHGVQRQRKSIDRSIIAAYLRNFPHDHPAFDRLTYASARVASRHDWPWRERGTKWDLWKPDQGPDRLSRALLSAENPAHLLREIGLERRPCDRRICRRDAPIRLRNGSQSSWRCRAAERSPVDCAVRELPSNQGA